MNRSIYFSSMLVILVAIGLMAYILYSFFYPFNVAQYYNSPFPVLNANKEIRRGEVLAYEVDFCKHLPLPTIVGRELIGETRVVTLTSIKSNFPAGCKKVTVERLKITEDIPKGEYRLRLSASWEVNPIRTVTKVVETEPFNVK